jgi:hypothetical protein
LNVNHASSLADAIPSGQRISELLDYDVDPRSVFEGAKAFMVERVEPFGGTVWGLVLTPASSKSTDEYEIEAGGWRILAWLVDLWSKDSEDSEHPTDKGESGEYFHTTSPLLYHPVAYHSTLRIDSGVGYVTNSTRTHFVFGFPHDHHGADLSVGWL